MKAEFFDFSFGFALTHELVGRYGRLARAAPEFPSLFDEGRGKGYDVNLGFRGFFLFLQFKLADLMFRRSAKQWPWFRRPYFRFALMPLRHSQQHSMLLDCELGSPHHFVYYAAPALHSSEDFNAAFLTGAAVSRTAFVRPSSIGYLPDRGEHHVVFDLLGRHFYMCSEPSFVEGAAFGDGFVEELYGRAQTLQPQVIDEEAFAALANKLKLIVAERRNLPLDLMERLESLPPVERAVYMGRTFLDSELLVLHSEEDGVY
jgi:hypothetical protein